MREITKWDLRFLQLAQLVSTWAKDPSTKTGAVIVRPDNTVVSLGYNGFPKKMCDDESLYNDRETKYSRIIHCEVNALMFAGRLPENCTLYTWPFLSCDRCAVQMLQAGIKYFVAPEATPEQLLRWEEAFKKTREYIEECGGEYLEIPRNQLNAQIF
jgi:dCMP deaminase